jgi:Lipid A 3-O-deacylase (PagL)
LRGQATRARRAAFSLVALLFFLEGARALAQPQAEPGAWHVIATYGQASAPRSQGFAEAATLSAAREFPLGAGFSWGLELTPLLLVNLTRVDLPGRPRESRAAVAAAPFLSWEAFPRSPVGLRLEASVGPLWAFSPVPAEGSRFNFLDILGGRVHVRVRDGVSLSGGLRRTHVSNLGFVGPDNPGLSFYSGVIGLSWPAR